MSRILSNIESICRFCALDTKEEAVKFAEIIKEKRYDHLISSIHSLLDLDIADGERLPPSVCMKCLYDIELLDAFVQRCKNAQFIFRCLYNVARLDSDQNSENVEPECVDDAVSDGLVTNVFENNESDFQENSEMVVESQEKSPEWEVSENLLCGASNMGQGYINDTSISKKPRIMDPVSSDDANSMKSNENPVKSKIKVRCKEILYDSKVLNQEMRLKHENTDDSKSNLPAVLSRLDPNAVSIIPRNDSSELSVSDRNCKSGNIGFRGHDEDTWDEVKTEPGAKPSKDFVNVARKRTNQLNTLLNEAGIIMSNNRKTVSYELNTSDNTGTKINTSDRPRRSASRTRNIQQTVTDIVPGSDLNSSQYDENVNAPRGRLMGDRTQKKPANTPERSSAQNSVVYDKGSGSFESVMPRNLRAKRGRSMCRVSGSTASSEDEIPEKKGEKCPYCDKVCYRLKLHLRIHERSSSKNSDASSKKSNKSVGKTTTQSKPTGNSIPSPWTPEEYDVICKFFEPYIKEKKVPPKSAAQDCILKNFDVLSKRDSMKIYKYVLDRYFKGLA